MIKHLVGFFLIGTIIVLTKPVIGAIFERREIEVRVPSPDTPSDRMQALQAEILLDQAFTLGWAKSDPTIFQHLVENMRFVRGSTEETPQQLFDDATRLGMQRSDPIVRERLLQRARAVLSRVESDQQPDEQTLRDFIQANASRYQSEVKYEFSQVFLRRETDGSRIEEIKRSIENATDVREAYRVGDPMLRLRPVQKQTLNEMQADFGESFAKSVANAPIRIWAGPFDSTFGKHFIYVWRKDPASLPAFEILRKRVRVDYIDKLKESNFRERYAALQKMYNVHWVTQ